MNMTLIIRYYFLLTIFILPKTPISAQSSLHDMKPESGVQSVKIYSIFEENRDGTFVLDSVIEKEYKLNIAGKATEVKQYTSSSAIVYQYEYNPDNMLIKEVAIKEDTPDMLLEGFQYKYNKKGKLILTTNIKGTLAQYKASYKYNSKGLMKSASYILDGELYKDIMYKYNDKDSLVRIIHLNRDFLIIKSVKYEYPDTNTVIFITNESIPAGLIAGYDVNEKVTTTYSGKTILSETIVKDNDVIYSNKKYDYSKPGIISIETGFPNQSGQDALHSTKEIHYLSTNGLLDEIEFFENDKIVKLLRYYYTYYK